MKDNCNKIRINLFSTGLLNLQKRNVSRRSPLTTEICFWISASSSFSGRRRANGWCWPGWYIVFWGSGGLEQQTTAMSIDEEHIASLYIRSKSSCSFFSNLNESLNMKWHRYKSRDHFFFFFSFVNRNIGEAEIDGCVCRINRLVRRRRANRIEAKHQCTSARNSNERNEEQLTRWMDKNFREYRDILHGRRRDETNRRLDHKSSDFRSNLFSWFSSFLSLDLSVPVLSLPNQWISIIRPAPNCRVKNIWILLINYQIRKFLDKVN